jgi:apolipoprotein N-acyltransferase
MKRYLVAAVILTFALVELVLALWGPMAFVQKPSTIVTEPYYYGLEGDEVDAVFGYIQRVMARTKLFRVISHQLIEDYYLEKQDDPDFTLERHLSYHEYQEISADLGLERIVVTTIYPNQDLVSVSIVIRHVESGQIQHRLQYVCESVQAFLDGESIDGPFSLVEDLRVKTRGVGLFDNLFFILMAGELLLAIAVAFRRSHDILNQILFVAGLLLALFAFVYAKNASMDYVQRFIANGGQISLAQDTTTEQLLTAARFAPLLLVNAGLYVATRVRRRARGRNTIRPLDSGWQTIVRSIAQQWGMALSLCAAFLYAIAFPSFLSLRGFPGLAWISLIPLFLAILYSRLGQGVFYAISFGALQTLILNYWHGTYSYISLAFSVVISSVLYALFAIPFVVLLRRSGRWGFVAAPAIWVGFEYIRTLFYIGYPWGLIGVSQYLWLPVIQVADVTGIWGITFTLVFVQSSVSWAIASREFRWRWAGKRWLPLAIAAAVVVVVVAYGLIRMIPDRSAPDREVRLVLVQQNTDPRKHDYRLSFSTLQELTAEALAESAPRVPDLIVWPEGGFKPDIRYWYSRPNASGRSPDLVTEFLDYAPALGTYLLTGSQDHIYREENGEEVRRNFNSTVLMGPDGSMEFYHKIHLVPFTEHFPYKEQYPWLAELLDKFDTSNWLVGDEHTVFEIPTLRFFTPICFEDIFAEDVRQFVLNDADMIVNVSNDYWSLTPVEGKQHAAHALLRAVENRLPMVRATASGLTTYITPTGRLSDEFPEYYSADYLMVDVPIRDTGMTLYTRFGNWFAVLCLGGVGLLTVGLLVLWGWRRVSVLLRSRC